MGYTPLNKMTSRLGAWEPGNPFEHHDHKKQNEIVLEFVSHPVTSVVKKTLERTGVIPSFDEKVRGIIMSVLQEQGLLRKR